jgi:hypothetical protein
VRSQSCTYLTSPGHVAADQHGAVASALCTTITSGVRWTSARSSSASLRLARPRRADVDRVVWVEPLGRRSPSAQDPSDGTSTSRRSAATTILGSSRATVEALDVEAHRHLLDGHHVDGEPANSSTAQDAGKERPPPRREAAGAGEPGRHRARRHHAARRALPVSTRVPRTAVTSPRAP